MRIRDDIRGVFSFPGVLSPMECAEIVLHAENTGFRAARLQAAGRLNYETFLLDSHYLSTVRTRLERYFKEVETGDVLEIYRYAQGQGISVHVDSPQRLGSHRFSNMTLVLYLTDDFEGGGTFFPTHNFTSIPEVGSALVFDQTLAHRAEVVRHGLKYVARANLLATHLSTNPT